MNSFISSDNGDERDSFTAVLTFVDELPSLYADTTDLIDAQQQQQRHHTLHYFPAAPPPPVETLSAEEIAELWRDIESEGEATSAGQLQLQLHPQSVPVKTQPQKQQKPKLLDESGSSNSSVKKKKKPAYNTNKARDQRREEIVFLRRTVMELETRLSMIKKKGGSSAMTTTSLAGFWSDEAPAATSHDAQQDYRYQLNSSFDTQPDGSFRAPLSQSLDTQQQQQDSGLAGVWKEIARRQCDERVKSERENIRLRFVLESQLKVARSLEKFLLLKAASTMEIAKTVDTRRRDPHQSILEHLSTDQLTNAAIYRDLLVGVEQSLADVDEVYETNGLARMETSQINANMRFDAESRMLVEVSATKVLPFGIHETGAAIWNHCLFQKQRMPSRYYSYHSHKSIDTTEDTIVEDFTLELHAKNTRANFRMRQIMRRRIEEERIVIVWHSFFDPLEFSEQHLSDVRFFEKGYIVVKKSSSSSPIASTAPTVTLLQPCYIISPFSTAGARDDMVSGITDFMLSATFANIAATHQMIENVLLEQALQQTSRDDLGG